MRSTLALLALGFAVNASASFELALISDRTANVVHRMDPVTGAYLGSFGQNFLNAPGGVVLDQANNTVYVADTNRVTRWNYNTGDYLGTFVTNSGAVTSFSQNQSDGSFNIATSGGIRRYTMGGSFIRTYTSTSGFGYQSGLLANDGFYYVNTHTTTSVRQDRLNAGSGALIETRTWACDRYLPLGGNNYINLYSYGVAPASNYYEVDTLNSGPINTGAFLISAIKDVSGGAIGHNGIVYAVGLDAAVTTRGAICKIDPVALSNGSAYGTSFLQNPSGIAVVVAPEPGGVFALALGATLILRTRRKAKA
ncbi:MAG: hypothetical protein K8R88_05840 [Armatimonadetes bacterium]|nr:hypothetical protein [Armatimonadota bacterium]